MSLMGCLSIACTSYPPDSIQSHSYNPTTPLRHFPDNLQTFRERRNQLIKITLIGFMSINITLYPQPILIDLGLSGICRRVSGWLWILPGWLSCQINCWNSNEGTLSIVLIGWFPFSRWPWISHWVSFFGVSVGCLEDFWGLSWVVWMSLDIVWVAWGGEGYDVKLLIKI